MDQRVMLAVTSLLTILFLTFHLADDIVRGFEPGRIATLTGVLILQRNMWGLWLGVAIACLSALMTVFVMFVFPLWAIAVLTIDFLVLFALLTESDRFTA